jgi:hypothetical protein
MTTKVTVTTVDWPVEVTMTDHGGLTSAVNTIHVEPNSEREFHLTDTRSIGLVELPKPEAKAEDGGAGGPGTEATAGDAV